MLQSRRIMIKQSLMRSFGAHTLDRPSPNSRAIGYRRRNRRVTSRIMIVSTSLLSRDGFHRATTGSC